MCRSHTNLKNVVSLRQLCQIAPFVLTAEEFIHWKGGKSSPFVTVYLTLRVDGSLALAQMILSRHQANSDRIVDLEDDFCSQLMSQSKGIHKHGRR